MTYFFKKPSLLISIFLLSFQFLSAQNLGGSHEINKTHLTQVLQVLDEYLSTFNSKDVNAWQSTYHFPHYRLANGKMSVLESATLDSTVFVKLQQGGWDHSRWEQRNVIQASPDKVHVDTRLSRYRKDGSKIGSYESLYIVTKENGKWGVKFRSSYSE